MQGKRHPAQPPEFYRSGELGVGVSYAGAQHAEVTIGPLTVDAELAAEAEMPDWIDPALIYRLWLAIAPVEDLAKDGLKRIEMSDADKAKASRMADARDRVRKLHRITRLGAIPPPDLPAAAKLILPDDFETIDRLAAEVDEAVERFRAQNATARAARSGAGDGGPAALDDRGPGL